MISFLLARCTRSVERYCDCRYSARKRPPGAGIPTSYFLSTIQKWGSFSWGLYAGQI